MTALAADKPNVIRMGAMLPDSPNQLGVKASTKIYGGSLCVNDAGVAAPGRTATGLLVLGVARKQYDNSAGSAGDIIGEFDHGDYVFVNDGSDAVVVGDIGALCYIVDDQTVCHTSTGKSIAGRVVAINPPGITGVVVRVATGMGV